MVERPITINFFEDNRFKPVDNTKIKNFRGAVKRLITEKRPCVFIRIFPVEYTESGRFPMGVKPLKPNRTFSCTCVKTQLTFS